MKTKVFIILMLLCVAVQPFGCQTMRKITRNKHNAKLDSTLNIKSTSNVNTFDISNAVKTFTEEKVKMGSKITYKETETKTVKGLDLNHYFVLDSIQPTDGSLNFTCETGKIKLNVKPDGKLLKVTQRKGGDVITKKVKELIIENTSEKSKIKADSTGNRVLKKDSLGSMIKNVDVRKSDSTQQITKDVSRFGIAWYWWVIGIIALIVSGYFAFLRK